MSLAAGKVPRTIINNLPCNFARAVPDAAVSVMTVR